VPGLPTTLLGFAQGTDTNKKRELGPYAFEKRMPGRIAALINAEASQNRLTGVLPVLASLLKQDRRVETAYLCNDDTTQVYMLPGEGNHFCGYRNIQMLLREHHSIPELQDMIERAWDKGCNSHSRIETGGIRDTRKHIGTSEVVLWSSYGTLQADDMC
jgi:zinc finger-containing ubiquitin peptidase 1